MGQRRGAVIRLSFENTSHRQLCRAVCSPFFCGRRPSNWPSENERVMSGKVQLCSPSRATNVRILLANPAPEDFQGLRKHFDGSWTRLQTLLTCSLSGHLVQNRVDQQYPSVDLNAAYTLILWL